MTDAAGAGEQPRAGLDRSEGRWTSRGAAETFARGEQMGSRLAGGEVILLDGALGAGKTVFVKGLADALGIDAGEVTSP